ncbi:DMT family transporter [Pelosinus propionicus]|uniref:Permease of the drug/metabolite transporter (DMT) superfamily n=1 Tax=Pelosinus propionicus DSM 13327 TaxID=1123291 RepID=A0A1I4Q6Q9_9FIRM|nr:DMT family transporter [Pelosinus propionicus]SFM35788.1 Permease of the drug/metabolite transporter (DMT) superfamily [Pelosinus propionicus DSM 13327]
MIDKNVCIKVVLAISVTIVLWASAFVGIRATLQDYQPTQLAAFRYIVASIILIPLAYNRKIQLPKSKDVVSITFTGFFGFTLYNIVLNYGEKLVTAASACFIVNGGNLFTAILAAFLLKEKVPPATWFGMIVSLLGIGIISWGESGSLIVISSGTFLVFLAAFLQSMYFILQKSLLLRYSSFELICYSIWIGTIALLPMSSNLLHSIQSSSIQSTLSVIYLGIFPAVIAYFCWSYVLSNLDASKATVYLFLVPIVTLLIGYLWLGEIPSLLAIIGGLITILGVVIAKYWRIVFDNYLENVYKN